MNRIHKIVIACFKYDLFLLRSCVASIRYWYPNIEIYLLKDLSKGNFSTTEIEQNFKVHSLQTSGKYTGYGYSKFEAYFLRFERFLLLDADTIIVGKVLEELSKFDEDFIVTGVLDSDSEATLINHNYINSKISEIDPEYRYPGYGINTGHIVITPGLISHAEINQMFYLENGRLDQKHKNLLLYADQGIINYLLALKKDKNQISIRYHNFWLWPPNSEEIALENQKNKNGSPYVIHWAGLKPKNRNEFSRIDLLNFYNSVYYSDIPLGFIKRFLRSWAYFIRIRLNYGHL